VITAVGTFIGAASTALMAITPYVHPAPAPVVNVTVQPLVSPPDCREGSQHRRTGRLPPAQRHVRRLEQRPQPRDPLEGHRLAACPPNPLHDHRRRHLRELRQKSPDLRLEPIHSRTRAARTYLGGSWLVTAFFTAFREISSLRAIARIAIPSARCSLQISAQSSTFSTPRSFRGGSKFTWNHRTSFSASTDIEKVLTKHAFGN
jgi:hypothetical protein